MLGFLRGLCYKTGMKNKQIFPSDVPPVSADFVQLKTINSELTAANDFLQKTVEMQALEMATLKHHIGLLKSALFGKKSEKQKPLNGEQLSLLSALFNEAEAGAAEEPAEEEAVEEAAPEPAAEPVTPPAQKKPGRKPLPANLPRKQIIHDLPESEKHCACGCMLTKIGEDTTDGPLCLIIRKPEKANGRWNF